MNKIYILCVHMEWSDSSLHNIKIVFFFSFIFFVLKGKSHTQIQETYCEWFSSFCRTTGDAASTKFCCLSATEYHRKNILLSEFKFICEWFNRQWSQFSFHSWGILNFILLDLIKRLRIDINFSLNYFDKLKFWQK